MHEHLCPYCGGRLTGRGVCVECGSLGDANRQYSDPIEGSWQQGRFLRRFKYGKLIAAVTLAGILYGLIISVYDILRY